MNAQGESPLSARSSPPRDERWFEELFRRHHRAVHAYVLRRVPADGEDLVAEVFTIAWRKRDHVPESALPWLYSVASREVLHAHRTTTRRESMVLRFAAAEDVTAPDSSEETAARLSAAGPVTDALSRLPDADAEILRLWAWEQLEPTQIAAVLGISSVAARVRLHRARKRLEGVLTRRAHGRTGLTHSGALPPPSPRLATSELSHD